MKFGARIQASIEVLSDILERRTPATLALRDWGKSNRYAGSKDRAVIGNLVYDALRRKSSIAWRMNDDTPRALALGAACFAFEYAPSKLIEAFKNDKFAPSGLTDDEFKLLSGAIKLDAAPDWIRADIPEWIWPAFDNNFGEEAVIEGQALTQRPPLDLRVNRLKADRDPLIDRLKDFSVKACPIALNGLRIDAPEAEGRLPNIQAEQAYQTGLVEIQDEGSQIVSTLVAAKAGETVLDFCAGGGGKSLALAGDMQNEGRILAFDIDKRRLAPLYQRALRADASIIEVLSPPLSAYHDLKGKMDRVLVDAPCTGVGTWRRKPDAKWRLTEDALERRNQDQAQVLQQAAEFVRSGGLMFYVTCSMLAEENEAQVYAFLDTHPDFSILSAGEVWEERFGVGGPKPWSSDGCSVTLTPASTQTDGFYFAVLEKQSG